MREVNYLTDKSQDSEKLLSFKEQILRDLEEANEQLLKIEKEYDLPDRSIETPSSLNCADSGQPFADCDRGYRDLCCDLYPFSCQADG